MFNNIGTVDRGIRVIVGMGAISLAFWGPRSAWAWLGLIPLATVVVGFCPLYGLMGIRTTPRVRR